MAQSPASSLRPRAALRQMPDAVIGDLIMLTMGSGRERTESEHAALLAAAGLQLTRVIPTRSGSVILEAATDGSAS